MRWALRAWITLRPGPTWHVVTPGWPLGELLRDVLPDANVAAVLIGTPGPAQKIVVECRDAHDRVLGYVKCAQLPAARRRLCHERDILNALPQGVGPSALKYASWQGGDALVLSPVPGIPLPCTLPAPPALLAFVRRLAASGPVVDGDDHPWLQRERATTLDSDLALLRARPWPVIFQHGDLAPWNVHRTSNGTVQAIDWEYGTATGFPFIDLAYYVLQTAALIYRWPPARAARYAAASLQDACLQEPSSRADETPSHTADAAPTATLPRAAAPHHEPHADHPTRFPRSAPVSEAPSLPVSAPFKPAAHVLSNLGSAGRATGQEPAGQRPSIHSSRPTSRTSSEQIAAPEQIAPSEQWTPSVPWPLSEQECAAIVRLAAYAGYQANERDGVSASASLQRWRRAIWNQPR